MACALVLPSWQSFCPLSFRMMRAVVSPWSQGMARSAPFSTSPDGMPTGDGSLGLGPDDAQTPSNFQEIEEIRADAREQIEKYRQETRHISAEISLKRQEHTQKMLDLQQQKEHLESEVCGSALRDFLYLPRMPLSALANGKDWLTKCLDAPPARAIHISFWLHCRSRQSGESSLCSRNRTSGQSSKLKAHRWQGKRVLGAFQWQDKARSAGKAS